MLRHATAVDLPLHTVLYEQHRVPRYGFFLLSGLASVLVSMTDGQSVEVGFIGTEGLVGAEQLIGPASLSTRCEMQLNGAGLRVPLKDMQQAFDESQEVRSRMLEFVQQQGAVSAQIAACNRLHEAEQRLIRWLLMAQDRTGYETLNFTQEFMSQMIATQRSTVTVIAGDLQRRGLLGYSRGKVTVTNRAGLERTACSCYAIVKRLLADLYRHTGRTGHDDETLASGLSGQTTMTT